MYTHFDSIEWLIHRTNTERYGIVSILLWDWARNRYTEIPIVPKHLTTQVSVKKSELFEVNALRFRHGLKLDSNIWNATSFDDIFAQTPIVQRSRKNKKYGVDLAYLDQLICAFGWEKERKRKKKGRNFIKRKCIARVLCAVFCLYDS